MSPCRVCGLRPRTEDQHFCRACGSALVGSRNDATVSPVPARSWAAVLAPLAVAVVCATTLTLLAAAISPTVASGLDTLVRGGAIGSADPTIPQPSSSTQPSSEPSASSQAPTPEESTETSEPPSPEPSTGTSELLEHIPSAIAASCVEDPGLKELRKGLLAAVACDGPAPGYVDKIIYMQYDSDSSMHAAYRYVVDVYANGTLKENPGCDDGSARGRWHQDSKEAGRFACYETFPSGVRLYWSTYGTAILARASDEDMSVAELWDWFLKTKTGPF